MSFKCGCLTFLFYFLGLFIGSFAGLVIAGFIYVMTRAGPGYYGEIGVAFCWLMVGCLVGAVLGAIGGLFLGLTWFSDKNTH